MRRDWWRKRRRWQWRWRRWRGRRRGRRWRRLWRRWRSRRRARRWRRRRCSAADAVAAKAVQAGARERAVRVDALSSVWMAVVSASRALVDVEAGGPAVALKAGVARAGVRTGRVGTGGLQVTVVCPHEALVDVGAEKAVTRVSRLAARAVVAAAGVGAARKRVACVDTRRALVKVDAREAVADVPRRARAVKAGRGVDAGVEKGAEVGLWRGTLVDRDARAVGHRVPLRAHALANDKMWRRARGVALCALTGTWAGARGACSAARGARFAVEVRAPWAGGHASAATEVRVDRRGAAGARGCAAPAAAARVRASLARLCLVVKHALGASREARAEQ